MSNLKYKLKPQAIAAQILNLDDCKMQELSNILETSHPTDLKPFKKHFSRHVEGDITSELAELEFINEELEAELSVAREELAALREDLGQ